MPARRLYWKAWAAACVFSHVAPAMAVDAPIPPFACQPAETMIGTLEREHGEAPSHSGEALNGQLEIWFSAEKRSWTLIGLIPGAGLACLITMGQLPPEPKRHPWMIPGATERIL